MWESTQQILNTGRVCRFSIHRDGVPLPYSDALQFWQHDKSFRTFFIALLAKSGFSAYRWETPSITTKTASRQFEFVLIDSPGLNQVADSSSFASHFERATLNERVVVFSNLGGDATLVVPRPVSTEDDYGHLAAFVRSAPLLQVHEFWQSVGAAMSQKLGSAPTWLSTAGMGVPWLHARLDSRPKYYSFNEYRKSE